MEQQSETVHSGVHTLELHSNETDPTFTYLSCDNDSEEADQNTYCMSTATPWDIRDLPAICLLFMEHNLYLH